MGGGVVEKRNGKRHFATTNRGEGKEGREGGGGGAVLAICFACSVRSLLSVTLTPAADEAVFLKGASADDQPRSFVLPKV